MPTGLQNPLLTLAGLSDNPPLILSESAIQIFDLLPIGVQIDNALHRTIYVNACFTETLGYSLDDIADNEDWFRCTYPDPAERAQIRGDWARMIGNALETGAEFPVIERRLTCKNGEKKTVEFYISRIGEYFLYLNIDVSPRSHLADEMRRLAFTDSLTGSGNRRSFFAAGEELLGAGRRPLAGLMVDLDHFKSLNDRFGHKIGDEALIEVAARCRSVLNDEQHLARLGGEEFGVLLPGFDRPSALAVATRLHHAITAQPLVFPTLGLEVAIGTCIGVAMAAADETGIDGLMVRADRALYEAKRSGRNRVCCAEG